MIQEEYVTFETAKLLKKAGFPQGGNMQNYKYDPTYFEGFTEYEWCTKPTQAQAMRWLRQEKQIAIGIDYTGGNGWEYCMTVDYLSDPRHAFSIGSDTYEAAAEAGIQAACEYLIEKGGEQ